MTKTKSQPASVTTAAVIKKPRRMARAPQNPVSANDAATEEGLGACETPPYAEANVAANAPTRETSPAEPNSEGAGAVIVEAKSTEAGPVETTTNTAQSSPTETPAVMAATGDADISGAESAPAQQAMADSQSHGGDSESVPPTAKRQTKQDLVLGLLRQEGGVDLAAIVAATGWLPHTARAALTGLKKKGHAVQSIKVDKLTRYSLV